MVAIFYDDWKKSVPCIVRTLSYFVEDATSFVFDEPYFGYFDRLGAPKKNFVAAPLFTDLAFRFQ